MGNADSRVGMILAMSQGLDGLALGPFSQGRVTEFLLFWRSGDSPTKYTYLFLLLGVLPRWIYGTKFQAGKFGGSEKRGNASPGAAHGYLCPGERFNVSLHRTHRGRLQKHVHTDACSSLTSSFYLPVFPSEMLVSNLSQLLILP